MSNPRNELTVYTRTIKDDLYLNGTLMLSYTIEYPQFDSQRCGKQLDVVNRYYKLQALELNRYYRNTLYPMAVEQYQQALEEDFPFNGFGAQQNFTVTYNRDCVLSLYIDRYAYTGGAHGNTVRTSDTWCVRKGSRVTLDQLFPKGFDYRSYILPLIVEQIEEQIKNDEVYYFDNYPENVDQYFDPTSFYLTDRGATVYFQLYEIAPYAAGFREFLIPFSQGGLHPPVC